jgi:hypothetical protein
MAIIGNAVYVAGCRTADPEAGLENDIDEIFVIPWDRPDDWHGADPVRHPQAQQLDLGRPRPLQPAFQCKSAGLRRFYLSRRSFIQASVQFRPGAGPRKIHWNQPSSGFTRRPQLSEGTPKFALRLFSVLPWPRCC